MFLMPPLQTLRPINIMHNLLPLRPTNPSRLGPRHNASHFIRSGQLGINGRRKRMDQLRPMMIPQPQHGATVGAEIALAGADLLVFLAAVFDRGVLSAVVS